MFNSFKNYMNFIMIYHFYQKKRKLKSWKIWKLNYSIIFNCIQLHSSISKLTYWIICYTHKKLKANINNKLALKKFYRAIKFNQNVEPKSYVDLNTNLRRETKKITNKAFYWKVMENMKKYRGIKLVTIENRRNHFVSEANFFKDTNERKQRYLWIKLSIWGFQY